VWRPMAPAPFDDALLYPSGVWTGTEVVVMGTPCPDPNHEEDGEYVNCEREPVAAAYSPTANSWRSLPPPPLPEPMHGYSILSSPVGVVDGKAVFSYQSQNVRVQLMMIDPTSGATTFAVAPTEPCAVGGRLLAFGPDSDGSFGSPVEPSPETMRVREWGADRGW
jgi:hypothetical protein